TAMHIFEGRWLRDRRYSNDYIDFMYSGGGDDRHFSDSVADAVYAHYLVDGDKVFAVKHLDSMEHIYALWDDHYDFDKKLYWIEPLLDATEYTIASIDASGGKDGFTGGEAFRPSINSYMYANARAISRLAALQGDAATAALYADKAQALRQAVEQSLWSGPLQHFIDRYKVDNAFVHYWKPIRGRELVGYLPWYAELPDDTATYAQAWRHILSPDELAGAFGLRTNAPSYPNYMRQYRYDKASGGRECQWNGPVWPFQTTQVLVGLANLLNDYQQTVVTPSDYTRLLKQYARLHLLGDHLDLQEDYDPATGKPIVGLARSHHYNHSGFNDLIISGLVGLRPRADDRLVINPLAPADPADPNFLRYFALQDAPYHGHLVSVLFDADGQHYRRGVGLFVYIDGRMAAHAPRLQRMEAAISQAPLAAPRRPIDLAVSLTASAFPKATASVNGDPASVRQAIDGRVEFFPEAAKGWSTAGSSGTSDWYAVDFGRRITLSSAELSFLADKDDAAPLGYTIQTWQSGAWADIALSTPASPLQAGGVDRHVWPALVSDKLRVVFTHRPGIPMRLVQLKVF
ncbi:MAG: MGH1-like glycoside hydrolase domain-containing protein, partial [Caulobacteraceae bacterium]